MILGKIHVDILSPRLKPEDRERYPIASIRDGRLIPHSLSKWGSSEHGVPYPEAGMTLAEFQEFAADAVRAFAVYEAANDARLAQMRAANEKEARS